MNNLHPNPTVPLVDQQIALSAYFDSLLTEPVAGTADLEAHTDIASPSGIEERMPQWAQKPFQCLLFNIGRLTLGAPMGALHGILDWDGGVTAMPNSPSWYLGLMSHRGNKVKIVDTEQIVVPSQYRNQRLEGSNRHVVIIDQCRWGLVCDQVVSVVEMNCDDIRWRTATTSRPWLAGTAITQMCGVLDVQEFAKMLGSDSVQVLA
ncbi:MAG TPA: chemotaxis protein CheW [Acidiferrobacteraceae bacterium]|nr:chemotaxis protein CheW [Acidiferrobacteraceae bacterium]